MVQSSFPDTGVVCGLKRLAVQATGAGVSLELALIGQRVLLVAYRIDGPSRQLMPNHLAVRIAAAVAYELGLNHDWIEHDVAAFLSANRSRLAELRDYFGPGLTASVDESARVMASKLHLLAGSIPPNSTDKCDVAFLAEVMGLHSASQMQSIYAVFFPDACISNETHTFIGQICPGIKTTAAA